MEVEVKKSKKKKGKTENGAAANGADEAAKRKIVGFFLK